MYVASVGSQYRKTRSIDNDLNPVWNESFEFVVDYADGQKLRIECFDKDLVSKDDELGWLVVDLSSVKKKGKIDRWFPLEGCKHGDIRIQVSCIFLPCKREIQVFFTPLDTTFELIEISFISPKFLVRMQIQT